jgi:hypothetical protein
MATGDWSDTARERAAVVLKQLREGRAKARALLSDLENAGFAVALEGQTLKVSPGSKLSSGQKEAIRENKGEVIAVIKERLQPPRPALKADAEAPPPGEARHEPAPTGLPGPAPDYRDWRLEWIYRVGILYLRIQECPMADVTTMGELSDLTWARPKSLAECLEWGRQVNEVEGRQRKLGCLPPYPWPEREPKEEKPDAQPEAQTPPGGGG